MNEISQKSHGKELVCNLLLPGSLVCCSAESGSTICCSLAPSVVRCSLYYRDVNSTWGGQSESSLTSGISGSSGSVPWFRLRTLLACALVQFDHDIAFTSAVFFPIHLCVQSRELNVHFLKIRPLTLQTLEGFSCFP